MTFEPIGQNAQTLAEKSQSVGGVRRGKTASEVSPLNSSEIAAWLSQQSPADMDRAAVSRAQSRGVGLAVKTELRFPENAPMYEVAVGCAVDGTDEQRARAKADLENFMTPAPISKIEEWLAELSVLTAGKGPDGVSAELLVTAYSSRLGQYPADVVHDALRRTSWHWFPTWAELEKVCKAKTGPRRHMIAALSKPAPDQEPVRRPPTQDERERVQALVDEMFPQVSREWREAAISEALKGDCMGDGGEQ